MAPSEEHSRSYCHFRVAIFDLLAVPLCIVDVVFGRSTPPIEGKGAFPILVLCHGTNDATRIVISVLNLSLAQTTGHNCSNVIQINMLIQHHSLRLRFPKQHSGIMFPPPTGSVGGLFWGGTVGFFHRRRTVISKCEYARKWRGLMNGISTSTDLNCFGCHTNLDTARSVGLQIAQVMVWNCRAESKLTFIGI